MKVIIISGPTATGKTDLSIELAKQFGGEIVNFDSLLLYKEITIGTAKPTQKERGDIPHHMIDVSSISSPLNASDYAKLATPVVNDILRRDKLPFIVGGSGFYLQALMKGMYDSPTTPLDIQERSEKLYHYEGIKPFLEILKTDDPASFERYHENDHYRIRRAVEHFWSHGTPLSAARTKKDQENALHSKDNVHGWDTLHLHLDIPKDEHLQIIEKRTDKMLELGLLQEVEELLKKGFTGQEKPLQSIGYKEVMELHLGLLKDLKECRERIIIFTRQLAKSQRTWFNRIENKLTFHPIQDKSLILEEVKRFLPS